jgi:protein gp37
MWIEWPKNVCLGVTVCNESEVWKIKKLSYIPAAVKFVSIEPLLGPINISPFLPSSDGFVSSNSGPFHVEDGAHKIDLAIVGGESGPGARPTHPDWVRSVRDQCAESGVPFLFKQWGEWCPGENVDDSKKYKTMVYVNGEWVQCSDDWQTERDDGPIMYRVGKKKAGRMLDGKIHDVAAL